MVWGHTCWTIYTVSYHVTQSVGTNQQSKKDCHLEIPQNGTLQCSIELCPAGHAWWQSHDCLRAAMLQPWWIVCAQHTVHFSKDLRRPLNIPTVYAWLWNMPPQRFVSWRHGIHIMVLWELTSSRGHEWVLMEWVLSRWDPLRKQYRLLSSRIPWGRHLSSALWLLHHGLASPDSQQWNQPTRDGNFPKTSFLL